MSLQSLFVDFNSYFASVEQQLRPELRGKPVGVVPVMAETTCCIAASYEAKKFGVKTGTIVADARRMCKDIIMVEARPAVYVEMHNRLVQAVESCYPVAAVLSIDEMACQLTGRMQQRERAVELAHRIKRTIYGTVGTELRSSIGIAPNTLLAKIASDMQKPDGLVVIELSELPQRLFDLTLRDIPGIGAAMERQLQRNGIHTVEDLCTVGPKKLRVVWGGIEGERMHRRLHGEQVWVPPTRKSTVGHSHVLPPEQRTEDAAFAVIHRLTQKAAVRLRSYGLLAAVFRVYVRYLNGMQWGNEMHFTPTDDTVQLLAALSALWKKKPVSRAKPLAVGMSLFKLTAKEKSNLSLFEEEQSRDALNSAIDSLNARYGKNLVYFGGAHEALDSAPMRIAFNHVPDPSIEDR